MLADEAQERVTVAGSCGLTPEYIALVSDEGSLVIHPPGSELDTPAARAFREARTIAVPEVRAARAYGRLKMLAPALGYRSLIASPLRAPDEVIGLLVGTARARTTSTPTRSSSSSCWPSRPRSRCRPRGSGPGSRR